MLIPFSRRNAFVSHYLHDGKDIFRLPVHLRAEVMAPAVEHQLFRQLAFFAQLAKFLEQHGRNLPFARLLGSIKIWKEHPPECPAIAVNLASSIAEILGVELELVLDFCQATAITADRGTELGEEDL